MRLISIEQNTPEWKEFRKFKIGASMASAIMGVNPWKTRLQLWEQIINDEEQVPTAAMIRGTQMEPEARDWYIKKTMVHIRPVVMQHHEHDWLIASLDGWDDYGMYPVEIKCPGIIDHEYAVEEKWVPDHYYPQLQHQMLVSGSDMAHYVSYDGHDNVIVEVKRDDEYIAKLFDAEEAFHNSLINFEQPAPCERDYTLIDDPIKKQKAIQYAIGLAQLKNLEIELEELKKDLIAGLNHPRCKISNLKISKVVRPGTIDYKAIEELKSVNLEKYRKKPIESWRITSND